MVGIVIVSHSAALADGVRELALGMAGESGVIIEAAGGLDEPDHPLGTDAVLVMGAIERAEAGDGVLVLMDLGSAVMSAEMAVDMLEPARAECVLLCEAPLVEGAVAAAATAGTGATLSDVAREARQGLAGKESHLSAPGGSKGEAAPTVTGIDGDAEETEGGSGSEGGQDGGLEATLEVTNRLGLHARPAARFVQTAAGFDAVVTVTNLTTGKGPADGTSLSSVATLGAGHGDAILVRATGPEARDALAALEALAQRNFGDTGDDRVARPSQGDDGLGRPGSSPESEGNGAGELEAPAPGALIHGLPVSGGLAAGPARRDRKTEMGPARRDRKTEMGPARRLEPVRGRPDERADDPDKEWAALEDALRAVRSEVEASRATVARRAGEDEAAIFDAHLLILEDGAILKPARALVFDESLAAAPAYDTAVQRVVEDYLALEDPYLSARADDVADVGRAVVAHVLGLDGGTAPGPGADDEAAPAPGVLVAAELAPGDVAGIDPEAVRGIALAYGAPTSHSSILTRALGIPAVAGLGPGITAIADGTPLILDGDAGTLLVDPGEAALAEHDVKRRAHAAARRAAARRAHEPAVTSDGMRVTVLANIGSPDDAGAAIAAGAEGIGLLRTEFLFMGRSSMPDEDEHLAAYRAVSEALGGRPLTIRTLDAGADKPLPYLAQAPEANPYLGVRGIRLGLAEPNMLRAQLRAVLRAAAEHPVRVMFPMVTTLSEFRAATALLDDARCALVERGVTIPEIPIGAMIEVPAAALEAGRLAAEADFLSIGTNDLAQYVMAAERGNEKVAALCDALSPPVLGVVRAVAAAGERNEAEVGVCGEVAGDPLAAPLLVGLGVTELSLSAPAIPDVKAAIRSFDTPAARSLAEAALKLDSAAAVRELLSAGPQAQTGAP